MLSLFLQAHDEDEEPADRIREEEDDDAPFYITARKLSSDSNDLPMSNVVPATSVRIKDPTADKEHEMASTVTLLSIFCCEMFVCRMLVVILSALLTRA